ncbi:DDE-type integrase/transposase/recombinase [Streptosporangium canum]
MVGRTFCAPAPNRLWVADLTYIRTWSGWVYAAFVIDVYSRMVVGWQIRRAVRDPGDPVTPIPENAPTPSLGTKPWTFDRPRPRPATLRRSSCRIWAAA